MKRTILAAAAALLIAACSTAPGTGWSRASDLGIYGSMHMFARAAVDQEVLCAGFSPASTTAHWERAYRARHEAVTNALTARYGEAAVAAARAAWAPSVPCGAIADRRWRLRYERQLRLLETRLGLRGGNEG